MWNELNPSRRYRNDILSWRAYELRLTPRKISEQTKDVSSETARRILRGMNANIDSIAVVARVLDIDRMALLNFKLKENQFGLAVLNGRSGGRGTGRSVY